MNYHAFENEIRTSTSKVLGMYFTKVTHCREHPEREEKTHRIELNFPCDSNQASGELTFSIRFCGFCELDPYLSSYHTANSVSPANCFDPSQRTYLQRLISVVQRRQLSPVWTFSRDNFGLFTAQLLLSNEQFFESRNSHKKKKDAKEDCAKAFLDSLSREDEMTSSPRNSQSTNSS
jgi:hypothetical protein